MAIKRLDPETVRLIAAGEVINRPLNAIKELLENSIDAGATNITVSTQSAGLSLLKITDNGGGIHEADFELLCARHATSKLSNISQLTSISSMGFRGEALASIAAISRVEAISRCPDSEVAFQYSRFI